MASEIKTKPTDADVTAFLDAVPDARRREEGHAIRALMERVSGQPAVMWGPTMVGFGSMPYTNTLGTNDWFIIGFSPRKAQLTIYGVYDDYAEPDAETDALFAQLGPHTVGKSCLYLKRLDAVDAEVLETLTRRAWERWTR